MISRNIIYSEHQDQFFDDVLRNRVASKMKEAVNRLSGSDHVGKSEYTSWQDSPVAIKNLIELSGIRDSFITFEYQVPYSNMRIDCLLYGKNRIAESTIIHIELKRWSEVSSTNVEGNFVETYVGKPNNRVAHPSQQVRGYHNHLLGFVNVFEKKQIDLKGYAYCHNYTRKGREGIYDPMYEELLNQHPVFASNDVEELADKLKEFLSGGQGLDVFNKFMMSPIKPSKKLLESASKIVEKPIEFSLLNEQILARNTILSKVRKAGAKKEKSVILIKGGPGTGKTVIALHILAEIAALKSTRSVFFATKSKPLLEGIKNKLGRGNRAKLLFTNLNQYIPSRVDENSVDVLLIDEAHRIGKSSNHQYTKAIDRTDLAQIEVLIRAAKTSIFFLDDKQVIRSAEIGNSELIKSYAEKYNCSVEEVELHSQFRCNGSDNYLDWLEESLNSDQSKQTKFLDDSFDFKVFDSPSELYNEIVKRDSEKGKTARIVAGFCWPWSKSLDKNGELPKDVKIGEFEMPWETHDNITPPSGYVRWYEWAYKEEGIKQVGCIYTAQGFEFDYIGVIIGDDLAYDPESKELKTNYDATKDPTLRRGKEQYDEYVRNIYRVLMTRGMKGCYVYFTNENTKNYFLERISMLMPSN